jgi:hypothetical protein
MSRSIAGSRVLALVLGGVVVTLAAPKAQTPDPPAAPALELVQRIRASAQFAQASTFIEADYDRFVRELIALNEIPAPPFK